MTVTLKDKTPLVVPPAVRRQAGFKHGDKIEFKVSRRRVTLISRTPDTDDVLTPDEAAIVKKAEREIRQGKYVTLAQLRHEMDRPRSRRSRKTA